MNKKMINNIAFDCYSNVNNDFDTVKFAELIIQECMNQCFSEDDEQRIAKYFGYHIEEEDNE